MDVDFGRGGAGLGVLGGGGGGEAIGAGRPPRAAKARRPASMVFAISRSASSVVSGDATRWISGWWAPGVAGERCVSSVESSEVKAARMAGVR